MNTFILTATGLLCGYAIGAALTAAFYESQISEGYVMEAEGYEDEGEQETPKAYSEPEYEVLTDEDWEIIDGICADELAGID